MDDARAIECTEVWGGTAACDVSVRLAGARGEVWCRPHRGDAVGGDIHYLSVCGHAILSKVVLADVSGHGAAAAEVSRIIHRALVESIGSHDNSTMLRRVNEAFLARRGDEFRFTTMAAMILDSRDRSLVYAYAGHPSILRGDAASGRFRPIEPERAARGGVPLGVVPGTDYAQHLARLEEGDVLVVYSDAFSEARGADGATVGEEGLVALLESAGTRRPAELKQHLLDALGDRLDDDASLIVLEVAG